MQVAEKIASCKRAYSINIVIVIVNDRRPSSMTPTSSLVSQYYFDRHKHSVAEFVFTGITFKNIPRLQILKI